MPHRNNERIEKECYISQRKWSQFNKHGGEITGEAVKGTLISDGKNSEKMLLFQDIN
jgi:hypothetical protein